MDKQYQLSIKSSTTDINVNSIDSNEIARIVQLAGMTPVSPMPTASPPVADVPTSPESEMPGLQSMPPVDAEPDKDEMVPEGEAVCLICGGHDHDEFNCSMSIDDNNMNRMIEDLEEEIAEYDHGHTDVDGSGEEVDVDSYIWQGSKLPQRIVKGGQGDNPLISELHAHLMSAWESYLAEDARENAAGNLSPLSDPTKPEFDKDPLSGEDPITDGSHSPMSTVKRQPFNK